MTAEIYDRRENKPSAPAEWDYGSILQLLWSSDNQRNWSVYARTERYRPFWDVHVSEPRTR